MLLELLVITLITQVNHPKNALVDAKPSARELQKKAPNALKSLDAELKSAPLPGWPHRAEANGPQEGEGNFPGCKALKNRETRARNLAPRRRDPVAPIGLGRHGEERSDEATQGPRHPAPGLLRSARNDDVTLGDRKCSISRTGPASPPRPGTRGGNPATAGRAARTGLGREKNRSTGTHPPHQRRRASARRRRA